MDNDQLDINLVGKNTDPNSPLNFAALRSKGIEWIQAFSGHAWTDFNLHDPGITILEHLCFTITDLAYRTHFDIRDILTGPEGTIHAERNLFYSRSDIFSTNPVTVNDLRKLVLDMVPEVYNVWLEKVYSNQSAGYIKGLYRVVIQLFDVDEENDTMSTLSEEEYAAALKSMQEAAVEKVRKVVLDHRNLGEDYVDFVVLKPCVIEVSADIVIDRHANGEEILAEVYAVTLNTLNPPIHFYTETELLSKGYALEDLYSGPALQHGFLLDTELDVRIKSMDPADLIKSSRYRIVDPSDIMKALAAIPGVLYIRNFGVKADGQPYTTPFKLPSGQFASFVFSKENRDIKVSNENNEIPVKESLFYSILYKKIDFAKRKFIKGLHKTDDTALFKGTYRNIEHYFSLQHLFPPAYRLGEDYIDADQPPQPVQQDDPAVPAKAKAKQLKAYLVFFEQVLANYLSQLTHIDKLLTAELEPNSSTYFSQPLYSVPGIGNVLKDFYAEEAEQSDVYWAKFKANSGNGYMSFLRTEMEAEDVFKLRKNRVLDHLMSRFNLNLKKYPVVFYSHLFYPNQVDEKLSLELLWKAGLLKDIVSLGHQRGRAFNYKEAADVVGGGFEDLICRLLFIKHSGKRKLADIFDQYTSRFQLQERDFYTAKTDKNITSVPVEWVRGSKMELLISEEELNRLLQEGVTDQQENTEKKQLTFNKQPISFLRDGLDAKNYRIGPDVNNSGFILIYKAPADGKWTRAGRFENWQQASDALSFLRNTLRDFNIESEGFHVVEHILLRPALDTPFFGFNFYDEKGHVLFYQRNWTSFMQREETVEQILAIATPGETINYSEMANILGSSCWINHWQNDMLSRTYNAHTLYHSDRDLAIKLFDKIIRNVQGFRKKKRMLYPGIENMINRLNDTDIREDFFHFRMTVVLPNWPARFQDKGFCSFVENLFREYTPAHIKLQFKWLGIGKMKKFESLYFDWRESMVQGMNEKEDINKKDKLISFISDGIDSIM